jgi:hypothetical protein
VTVATNGGNDIEVPLSLVRTGDPVESWRLFHGDALVAELIVTEADFPWLHARVDARPGLEALRPLFRDELALSERDEDADAWETAYARIRAALRLEYPDGRNVPEFLLHIEGDTAWWRWSDVPFE